jgi:hypothetical protein
MPTKPLDRLMFMQGGMCFFCEKPIPQGEASVEHLVASANGGHNADDNCVVCCKALNALFGSMSLKEKVQLVLNQKGQFRCPNKPVARKTVVADAVVRPSSPPAVKGHSEKIALIIADLHRRGSAKPRTVKALTGTISSLFQKQQLPAEEIASLIDRLRSDGAITLAGTKVSYDLPKAA